MWNLIVIAISLNNLMPSRIRLVRIPSLATVCLW
jgi:hypothetical protein